METIFLNPNTWDLALDTDGNIAKAKDPYAKAQDVASAVKLFKGELYYDTTQGLPYFESILGQSKQSLALYKHRLEKAAMTVPDVLTAKAKVEVQSGRVLSGAIEFTDLEENKIEVQLS